MTQTSTAKGLIRKFVLVKSIFYTFMKCVNLAIICMTGNAVDVTIWHNNNGLTEYVSPKIVENLAEQVGFTGIGTYTDFNHLDLREKKYKWTRS